MRVVIALLAVTIAACTAQTFGCGSDLKIDGKLRKQFLDYHNQKRRDIARGAESNFNRAKNMYKLSWSCDLEKKAQRHIQSCPSQVQGLGSTGANNMMWTISGGSFDKSRVEKMIKDTLDKWWEPAKQYRLDADNRYPRHSGLYNVANIINAATTKVGCTYNVCGNRMVILCLYDEIAYITEKILYDTGNPCTRNEHCTTYRKSTCDTATGLCVKPDEPRDNGESNMCSPSNGMTDRTRRTILDLHNDFRSLVARGQAEDKLIPNGFAPPAARMLKMEYDCNLEKTAANYARRCVYAHSLPQERDNAGENLYTVSMPDAEKIKAGEWATRAWFSELKEFGVGQKNLLEQWLFDRQKRNPKMKIGHYTQMVWGTTNKLGCGIQNCQNPKQTLVVCHYKQAGNVMARPPRPIYEVGPPCSKCPQGCTDDKLCIA
ncbi:SCP-like protein [Ancylostoma ceylanicum]|uniref:SCP-like protein n=3 Tax=Ancylostoma ceylanicum TaxID=53326 RepID=A0A0D6MCP6_9BILA|nr:SCP-like protein [Ancylostoma ceylanicum]